MNFIFSGSKEKFEQEISKWIKKNDVNKFIEGITKLSLYFSDDEYITVTSGFNSHAVVKLNEAEGEKCVVLEMVRTKLRIITEGVLPPRNRECFNINLNCKYR